MFFEMLEARRLLALVQAGVFLTADQSASKIDVTAEYVEIAHEPHGQSVLFRRFTTATLQEEASRSIAISPEAVDATVLDWDHDALLLEADNTIFEVTEEEARRLIDHAYFVGRGDELALFEREPDVLVSRLREPLIVIGDTSCFYLGVTQSDRYLFGEDEDRRPVVRPLSHSLQLGAALELELPSDIPTELGFVGSVVASYELGPEQEYVVIEYIAERENIPVLALASYAVPSGEFIADLGLSHGYDIYSSDGTLLIPTLTDIDLIAHDTAAHRLFEVPAGVRRPLSSIIDDTRVAEVIDVLDVASHPLGGFALLLEVITTDNTLEQYLWTAHDTTPFLNARERADVNDDGIVSPIDALLVINYLNRHGSGSLEHVVTVGPPYYDTSGNNFVSPLDALLVINHLNRASLV